MKSLVCLFLLLSVLSAVSATYYYPTCPRGQIYHRCKPCATDCKDVGTYDRCACKSGCACPKGYYLNGYNCVEKEYCPKYCPAGQIYHKCVGCNDCKDIGKPCTTDCKPGCKCAYKGYYWNGKKCAPENKCPNYCPAGQIYHKCVGCNDCKDIGKPCTADCKPGCKCAYKGYYWDGKKCVLEKKCPNYCPAGQIYHKCVGCNDCKDIGKPCTADCKPGCKCAYKGYYWDGNKCALEKKCPNYCPAGQIYHKCVGCNDCKDIGKPCTADCKPGCKCAYKGYYWDGKKCVLENKCPNYCPAGQIYHKCVGCNDCKDIGKPCTADCKPGCKCAYKGYYWDGNKCVLEKKCPNYCPAGQIYHKCVGCNDCKDIGKPCTADCKPGCKCAYKGYYWDGKKCVLSHMCPKKCTGKQIYYPKCAPCKKTCHDWYNPNSNPCPGYTCKPGCSCPPGWVWSEPIGMCTPNNFVYCPKPTCPLNMEHKRCYRCVRTCNYGRVCYPECKSGCTCKPNYYKNKKGKCVTRYQCPRLIYSFSG